MTPEQSLAFIRSALQPSVVSQLANSGTIDSYKALEQALNILEEAISPKKDSGQ